MHTQQACADGRPAVNERQESRKKKPLVGIIGEIGAGKSTVARWLAEPCGVVIEADQIAHETLMREDVVAKLEKAFGPKTVRADGAADRAAIARVVFADREKLRELERLLHPLMGPVLEAGIEKANADPNVRWIVLDAAVLLEAGWDAHCDAIVCVTAARERRLERVALSRGWDESELVRRESAQWPIERKKRRADLVVVNDEESSCKAQLETWKRNWSGSRHLASSRDDVKEPIHG